MSDSHTEFVSKARQAGLSDSEIVTKLVDGGWHEADARQLVASDNLVVPPPPTLSASKAAEQDYLKGSVVANPGLKFEYHMMFLTLWVAAIAIVWIFNVFLFSGDNTLTTFPLTALIVTAPIFMVLFSRVRSSEKLKPELKLDKQRRQTIQGTLSLSFVIIIVHIILALYQLFSGSDLAGKQLVSLIGTLATFGAIFVYFWVDIHSKQPA